MRIFTVIVAAVFVFASCGFGYAGDAYYEDDDSESTNSAGSALGGAVMGGLLGAGLGAAIGSASGHAGTGAAIGAGAGALGGTLLSASQAKQKQTVRSREEEVPVSDQVSSPTVKKRVVREYDEEGNVVSEREVAR